MNKVENTFRCVNTPPQFIRFPSNLQNVDFLLFERGIYTCHQYWQGKRPRLLAATWAIGVTI